MHYTRILTTWLNKQVPTTFPDVLDVDGKPLLHRFTRVLGPDPRYASVIFIFGTYPGYRNRLKYLYGNPNEVRQSVRLLKPLQAYRTLPDTGVYTNNKIENLKSTALLDRLYDGYLYRRGEVILDERDAVELVDCLLSPEEAALIQLQIELGNK